MTVRALSRIDSGVYIGLSSDTKPTDVAPMARFLETDTQDWFIFDGTSWAADLGQPVRASNTPGGDISNNVQVVEQGQFDYETVTASQTDQVLGVTGAAGDYLNHLVIVPATTGAGTVSIKDGSGSSINVFVAGTLTDLHPIIVPLHISSTNGAWKVTTGANVSVIAVGRFSA